MIFCVKFIEEVNFVICGDLENYLCVLVVYDVLCGDFEVLVYWDMVNYVIMCKFGYNDYGWVYVFIIGVVSMVIMELLFVVGVKFDFIESGVGDVDDVFLIVILGMMLYDIGN